MHKKHLILLSIAGFIISLDQLSKRIAEQSLEAGRSIPLLGSFVQICFQAHDGFAFGFLSQSSKAIHDIAFIGVPIFALILIVLIFIKLRDNQMTTSLALTMILSGALGNLIDRLRLGYVVDLVCFSGTWLSPLNLSDISILFGLAVMFWNTFIRIAEEGMTS